MLNNNTFVARMAVFVAGLFFAVVGIILILHEVQLQRECTVPATGVVIRYTASVSVDDNDERTTNYYPVFEYEVDGRPLIERSESGSTGRPYAIGESVSLKYNPNDPTEFVTEGQSSPSLIPYAVASVGILLMITSVLPGRLELIQLQ